MQGDRAKSIYLGYTNKISECAFIVYFAVLSFFPFNADTTKLFCFLTILGCWVTRMVFGGRPRFTRTPLNVPIFVFFLCAVASSFHSTHVKDSFHTLFYDYFVSFFIFFSMVNTIHGREQIQRIVTSMLVTGGLVCAYGLYGYYAGTAVYGGRLVATFEYHSRIAKYISLLLPIAVSLFFYYKAAPVRQLLALFICVCGLSLILTLSRASWVSVFVAVLFICFAARKKYLIFFVIGGCAVLIAILPSRIVTHAKTITQIKQFFTSETILSERLLCWKSAIAMMKERPVLGIGPGAKAFRSAYQRHGKDIKGEETRKKESTAPQNPKKNKPKKKPQEIKVEKLSHAHNVFLHIGAGTGIVGLLAFVWMLATSLCQSVKAWRSSADDYEKMLSLGITASLIALFSHGLTDSFWKKPDALFLWYVTGVLFVVIRNRTAADPL